MLNINTNDGGLSLAFRNGAGEFAPFCRKTLEEKELLMFKTKFKFGRE